MPCVISVRQTMWLISSTRRSTARPSTQSRPTSGPDSPSCLYVAPESLTKEENIEFLKTIKISFYAVDEAHCISEWGHDFRPEYRRIRPIINEINVRPVIALTATATPKVQHDIQKNLGMGDAIVYKSSFNRANLYYEVRPKTSNIDKDIIKFIKSHPGKSGIIYCLRPQASRGTGRDAPGQRHQGVALSCRHGCGYPQCQPGCVSA